MDAVTISIPRRRWVPLALVLVVLVLAAGLGLLTYFGAQHPSRPGLGAPPAGQLAVLWQVPAFSYVAQDGRRVTEQDLRGRVWITDFFFSQCTNVCPVLTAKLVMLQRQLPNPTLRFVSFSVDPAHDSPPVLQTYAAAWGADPRWLLLSTDATTLPVLCQGMRVAVAATQDPANPIIHSSLFMLVDPQGQVRGLYPSDDGAALRQLVDDANTLLGQAALPLAPGPAAATDSLTASATTSSPLAGQALYEHLACAGCHANPQLAPPLPGMLGHPAQLTEGPPVARDDTYLRNALLAPGQQVVAGYVPLMPSYRDQLSDIQLNQLVAYLKMIGAAETSFPGVAPSSASALAETPAQLVVDPVCQMKVRASPATPHAEYGGKTYYFCSDGCRDDFLADPKKYAVAP